MTDIYPESPWSVATTHTRADRSGYMHQVVVVAEDGDTSVVLIVTGNGTPIHVAAFPSVDDAKRGSFEWEVNHDV